MKKNLIAASVFVFGLVLGGASVNASSLTPGGGGGTHITEEMAQCIAICRNAGGTDTACWNCCVKNICAEL